MGSIHTYGNVVHTFLERREYKGVFLPGFIAHPNLEKINNFIDTNPFRFVDHVVGN